MSDLLKNPTLHEKMLALRNKDLPAQERDALKVAVLEDMRELVCAAQDLVHELKLPAGLSNITRQAVDAIDPAWDTTTSSLIDAAHETLYALDHTLWSLALRNSLWLKIRGTCWERASKRRAEAAEAKAAAERDAAQPFQGADAAEFGPKHNPVLASGWNTPEVDEQPVVAEAACGG